MAKIYQNNTGEFYTRIRSEDGFRTIHFDGPRFSEYMQSKNVDIGDELPFNWQKNTVRFWYTHGDEFHYQKKIYNTKCPICKKDVFYYENEHGSKVFFDVIGHPWEKHPCTIKNKPVSLGKEINTNRSKYIRIYICKILNIKKEKCSTFIQVFANSKFKVQVDNCVNNYGNLDLLIDNIILVKEYKDSTSVDISDTNSNITISGNIVPNDLKNKPHKEIKKSKRYKEYKRRKVQVTHKFCTACKKYIFCYTQYEKSIGFEMIGSRWVKHKCSSNFLKSTSTFYIENKKNPKGYWDYLLIKCLTYSEKRTFIHPENPYHKISLTRKEASELIKNGTNIFAAIFYNTKSNKVIISVYGIDRYFNGILIKYY